VKIKHNKSSTILGELPREEVLTVLTTRHNKASDSDHITFGGRVFSIGRMKVFAIHGCKCYKCGIEGTKVILTKDAGEGLHCDLYAERGSGFTLMNRDHILPASLGGKNHVWNMRPSCFNCNQKRGNKMTYTDHRLIRRRVVMGAIYRFLHSQRRKVNHISHELAYSIASWLSVVVP
jgi:hypothetical protein